MMEKHGTKAVKEFTSSAYSQFGMHVMVLTAFTSSKGEPSMTLSVNALSIYASSSQSQIASIIMAQTQKHLSRPAIMTGGSTKWSKISENGVPMPLVRALSALMKIC